MKITLSLANVGLRAAWAAAWSPRAHRGRVRAAVAERRCAVINDGLRGAARGETLAEARERLRGLEERLKREEGEQGL